MRNIVLALCVAALVIPCFADNSAPPTLAPTPAANPQTQPNAVADAVANAQQKLTAAIADADARLSAQDNYIAALTAEKAAQDHLDAVRNGIQNNGEDPNDLLDASSQHTVAHNAATAIRDDFFKNDAGVVAAQKELAAAQKALLAIKNQEAAANKAKRDQKEAKEQAMKEQIREILQKQSDDPTYVERLTIDIIMQTGIHTVTTSDPAYAAMIADGEQERLRYVLFFSFDLENATAGRASLKSADDDKEVLANLDSLKGKYIPTLDVNALQANLAGAVCIPMNINQVIDGSNMLVSDPYTDNAPAIWISGVDTTSHADGQKMTFKSPMHVTGTKTYTTVDGGTKTVFVLEPFIPAQSTTQP